MTYEADLGRQLSELIGAVGIYFGYVESGGMGNKDRLERAMKRALRSESFAKYMRDEHDPTI